jgi:hypothetical protein
MSLSVVAIGSPVVYHKPVKLFDYSLTLSLSLVAPGYGDFVLLAIL